MYLPFGLVSASKQKAQRVQFTTAYFLTSYRKPAEVRSAGETLQFSILCYEPRKLETAGGKVDIELPQLRNTKEPYRSEIMEQMGKRATDLERLVTEMYVRGLSTRDVWELLRTENGGLLLNRSPVSEIFESLYEEYEKFINRDLSKYDLIYIFVDGVYKSLRRLAAERKLYCVHGA